MQSAWKKDDNFGLTPFNNPASLIKAIMVRFTEDCTWDNPTEEETENVGLSIHLGAISIELLKQFRQPPFILEKRRSQGFGPAPILDYEFKPKNFPSITKSFELIEILGKLDATIDDHFRHILRKEIINQVKYAKCKTSCAMLVEYALDQVLNNKFNDALHFVIDLQNEENFETIFIFANKLYDLFQDDKIDGNDVVLCYESITKNNPHWQEANQRLLDIYYSQTPDSLEEAENIRKKAFEHAIASNNKMISAQIFHTLSGGTGLNLDIASVEISVESLFDIASFIKKQRAELSQQQEEINKLREELFLQSNKDKIHDALVKPDICTTAQPFQKGKVQAVNTNIKNSPLLFQRFKEEETETYCGFKPGFLIGKRF